MKQRSSYVSRGVNIYAAGPWVYYVEILERKWSRFLSRRESNLHATRAVFSRREIFTPLRALTSCTMINFDEYTFVGRNVRPRFFLECT